MKEFNEKLIEELANKQINEGETDTCIDCAYMRVKTYDDDSALFCFRFPPVPVTLSPFVGIQSVPPKVSETHW